MGRGIASVIFLKPFIVLAARTLGPGPTRLRLIKLAHTLNRGNLTVVEQPPVLPAERFGEAPVVQPSRRAA